jgi:hypothetical protein
LSDLPIELRYESRSVAPPRRREQPSRQWRASPERSATCTPPCTDTPCRHPSCRRGKAMSPVRHRREAAFRPRPYRTRTSSCCDRCPRTRADRAGKRQAPRSKVSATGWTCFSLPTSGTFNRLIKGLLSEHSDHNSARLVPDCLRTPRGSRSIRNPRRLHLAAGGF